MMPFSTATRRHHEHMQTRKHEHDRVSWCPALVVSWRKALGSPLTLPQAESFPLVAPCLNLLAPVQVVEIPADGLAQAGFERVTRRPSQLAANLRRVDRVPAVVTWTIRHERLQAAGRRGLRPQLVEDRTHAIDDVEIRALVAAAHIVFLARAALRERE